MVTTRTLVARSAPLGAAVAVGFFLLSLAVGVFPEWVLPLNLALCPPYILFMATAACGPYDSCTMGTLAVVAVANAVLYTVVALLGRAALSLVRRLGSTGSGGAA